jgi:2-amino-4-hydroxy-6-hydroxymethyldihydropteridine diphosphokinase
VKKVYLSLGTNIGDREANLRAAIDRMPDAGIHVIRLSPIYETEPVDCTPQAWFLNLVVEAETGLFPMHLLARTMRIERELGRVRTFPRGPRTIDIDILLYGRAVVRTARLEIPHPRIEERRFVLVPLADLAPDLHHPVTCRTIRELLAEAPEQIVRTFDLGRN